MRAFPKSIYISFFVFAALLVYIVLNILYCQSDLIPLFSNTRFIVAAGIAGVVILAYFFLNPKIVYFLLVFFMPFSEAGKIGNVSLPYMLSFILFVSILMSVFVNRGRKMIIYKPAIIFAIVYIMVSLLGYIKLISSSLTVPVWAQGLDAPGIVSIQQIVRLFLSMMIMFVVQNMVSNFRDIKKTMFILLFSAAVTSAYGIYQVVGTAMGFYMHLIPNTAEYGLHPGIIGPFVMRAVGTMKEPSFFAGFLVFSIFISTGYIFLIKGIHLFQRSFLFMCLIIQVFSLILTASTGAFIALAVSLTVLFFVFMKNAKIHGGKYKVFFVSLISVVLISLSSYIIISNIIDSFKTQLYGAVFEKFTAQSQSFTERQLFLKGSINIFLANPIIGIGAGNYGFYLDSYSDFKYGSMSKFIPNNVFGELLCEGGAISFLFFVYMLILIYLSLNRGHDVSKSPEIKKIFIVLKMIFISIIIQFMAYPTFKMEFIWLFFGLALAASRIAMQEAKHENIH